MDDKYIRFCKAPSGQWVGWIIKNNAHYWGSGRTLDDMCVHVKNTLYQGLKGASVIGYIIDTKPTPIDEVPVDLMSKGFRTRAWFGGAARVREMTNNFAQQALDDMFAKPKDEPVKYDYYEHKTENNELIVFGVIRQEVARFKLQEKPAFKVPLTVSKPSDMMLFNNSKPDGDDDVGQFSMD